MLSFASLVAHLAFGFSVPATRSISGVQIDHHRSSHQSPSLSQFEETDILSIRGGSSGGSSMSSTSVDVEERDSPKFGGVIASAWGSLGVIMILMKAIIRVFPIAMEPFRADSRVLTAFELTAYTLTCLFFAYAEGYKGFSLKFAPLVVSRSRTLKPGSSPFLHILLGPLYSMGLFHATRKRMIVSWSVTIGVAGIVAAVKRLPYPWRNIIDAGVVVGLSWGSLSILLLYLKSFFTSAHMDPALPKKEL